MGVIRIWHVSSSRPCEVPRPILSTQVGRTSTLGSLLGPGTRGVAHSVNCEQAVHSYFGALSVGAAHAIACDGKPASRPAAPSPSIPATQTHVLGNLQADGPYAIPLVPNCER